MVGVTSQSCGGKCGYVVAKVIREFQKVSLLIFKEGVSTECDTILFVDIVVWVSDRCQIGVR